MVETRRGPRGAPVRHRCTEAGRSCLYEVALRQAIATQHALTDSRRSELRACAECGVPYLLQVIWQPHSEESELACPRCGAIVDSWDGGRAFVAYWYREG